MRPIRGGHRRGCHAREQGGRPGRQGPPKRAAECWAGWHLRGVCAKCSPLAERSMGRGGPHRERHFLGRAEPQAQIRILPVNWSPTGIQLTTRAVASSSSLRQPNGGSSRGCSVAPNNYQTEPARDQIGSRERICIALILVCLPFLLEGGLGNWLAAIVALEEEQQHHHRRQLER